MENLENCPFCNSQFVFLRVENRKSYVQCNTCGACSGLYRTREKAIEMWNKREGMKDDIGKFI